MSVHDLLFGERIWQFQASMGTCVILICMATFPSAASPFSILIMQVADTYHGSGWLYPTEK